jgi:hypothetical protein
MPPIPAPTLVVQGVLKPEKVPQYRQIGNVPIKKSAATAADDDFFMVVRIVRAKVILQQRP